MRFRADSLGAAAQCTAGLLWIVQASAIAWFVQGLFDNQSLSVLWPAALVLALTAGLRSGLDCWGGWRLHMTARNQITALRSRCITALAQRSPLDSYRAPAGLAASVLAEQAETLLPYLMRYLPVRQRVLIQPLVITALVCWLSWTAALILLLAAPVIPLFMALVGWRAKAASEEQLLEHGALHAFLLDRLRGMTTLRAFGAVGHTAQRLQLTALSLKQRTLKVLRIAFLSSAVLELFSALGVALVAVYIGFHLLGELPFGAWGRKLTPGQSLFVLLLAPAFFEPLRELSTVWHDKAAGTSALQALHALSDQGSPLGAVERYGDAAGSGPDMLRLNNVTLLHPGARQPVLAGLSLQVQQAEHVALTGPSGCGKSTLLAAIAGLLPVQEGSITLNAAPGTFGWVGQQPHIFAGSVARNVSLGRQGFTRQAIDAALEKACLAHVAQARSSASLGEQGVGLSGGEQVRLALARIALDPGVQIILADEPTAHLDRQTAAEVIDALLAISAGKTLLVATHDPLLIRALSRQISLAPFGHRQQPESVATLEPCS